VVILVIVMVIVVGCFCRRLKQKEKLLNIVREVELCQAKFQAVPEGVRPETAIFGSYEQENNM